MVQVFVKPQSAVLPRRIVKPPKAIGNGLGSKVLTGSLVWECGETKAVRYKVKSFIDNAQPKTRFAHFAAIACQYESLRF